MGDQEITLSHEKVVFDNIVYPKVVNMVGNPHLIPLHHGSSVYVDKHDILKIFTNKPALYTVRLLEMVFGTDVLKMSCLPGDQDDEEKLNPLERDSFESVICGFFVVQIIIEFY